MIRLDPYLNFNGQCREAFELYARVLGGKIDALFTYADTPAPGETPPGAENLIMHARLSVGDQVLLGSDTPPGMEHCPAQGLFVSINVDEPAEADRIYNAFAEGGNVVMPIDRQFWAERFGMVVDRFGTPWMVNCPGDAALATPGAAAGAEGR